MPSPGVVSCAVLAGLVWSLPVSGDDNPKHVLARVREHLASYDRQLVALVADERYVQTTALFKGTAGSERVLESEFGWVSLPALHETIGVREVLRVGGRPVNDRRRLRALLERPPANPWEEIRAILGESSRWNLGPAERNINFPTFALAYLRSQADEGMRWRVLASAEGLELRFLERGRSTVIRSPEGTRTPAAGSVWIARADDRILRTVLSVRVVTDGVQRDYRQDVEFGPEPRSELWVPVRMRERFTAAGGLVELVGEATYTNYRRYETRGRLVW